MKRYLNRRVCGRVAMFAGAAERDNLTRLALTDSVFANSHRRKHGGDILQIKRPLCNRTGVECPQSRCLSGFRTRRGSGEREAAQSLGGAAAGMLSLYRAWLGPSPCVARPAPPPGAHRPVPRRARAPSRSPSPPASPPPRSPDSSASSELDVERIEAPEPLKRAGAVLDVASCDGPVRFSRVRNAAWRETSPGREWPPRQRRPRAPLHYYPCKTCGSKFPSYYFVHKHRKRCHGESEEPEPSTSSA
ncbi:unnamed protein product, partial [Iphiclides podalirius]